MRKKIDAHECNEQVLSTFLRRTTILENTKYISIIKLEFFNIKK